MSFLPEGLKLHLEDFLDASIRQISPVSGGSINAARTLSTGKQTYFIKINRSSQATAMFDSEEAGLSLINSSGAIRVPKVLLSGKHADSAFLLMEFVESGLKTNSFWLRFGEALAGLHQISESHFGLDHPNFIGTLPQPNPVKTDWISFYVEARLLPQVQMAARQGLLIQKELQCFENLYQALPALLPEEAPALIHGDLWSGNFLCSHQGSPYLIDPAVCFANREMDLAMSRLFGGFSPVFYESYQEAYPLAPGFEERIELYQLYYLLVHVNLFGESYLGSVRPIISRF